MIKISACVIVKNEEHNIENWLKNIKSIVNEMIVVDTGSEDKTMEIAKANGAAVYEFPWQNSFSAAKNYALRKAVGDWIVFLDADEYFSKDAQKKLRKTLEKVHKYKNLIAVDSPLHNIDMDNNNHVISTTTQTRIFRNRPDLGYRGRIHESLAFPKGQWQILDSDLTIFHTGYSTSLTEKKNRRNLELLLEDIKAAGGEKPEHYTYLSTTYLNLKEYDKAIHYANLAIETKTGGLIQAYVKQYRILLKAERGRNASDETLQKIVDRALADIPGFPDFLWEDAQLAVRRKDFAHVEENVLRILEKLKDPNFSKIYESTALSDMPGIMSALAGCRQMQGKYDEAAKYLEGVLKDFPHTNAVLREYLKMTRDKDAKKTLKFLQKIYDFKKDADYLRPFLKKRPRDAVYFFYMQPPKGSYEYLIGERKYNAAAQKAAEGLAICFAEGMRYYLDGKDRPAWEKMLPAFWKNDPASAAKTARPASRLMVQTVKCMRELALTIMMMSLNEFAETAGKMALLPAGMQNCLLKYHGGIEPLADSDFDAYHTLLIEVLNYGSVAMISRFVLMGCDFLPKRCAAAAEELYKYDRYLEALTFYTQIPDDSELLTGDVLFKIGVALFKTDQHETAAAFFARAKEKGATNDELPTYLKWCEK